VVGIVKIRLPGRMVLLLQVSGLRRIGSGFEADADIL
jgi:hypothetical protein